LSLYLGIDIGTFESKGVLVGRDGTILAEARRSHRMLTPLPGWAEHRAEEDWWGDFAAISRELLAGRDPARVRAVAASAIGPCMLPLDADGRPLTNAVLYGVDTRAAAEVARMTEAIGTERLIERTGQTLTSQSVGPKILWLKRTRPEVWTRAARVVSATSFLVERLTGECVIDHYSAASFGPLYDIEARDWTDALAPGLIRRGMLPRLGWTTEIAGGVTARAAEETGLAPGTPVAFGTIDAAAEALSVGVSAPGDAMLMYGSTIFIIALTAGRVRDPRLWHAPWLFPGGHAAMAGMATSGTLTHWLRDRFARELDPSEAFAALAAEAEAAPPLSDGVVVLPYFSGERTPIHDPAARGMIFGLNLTHGRGHVMRAALEGIACGTAHAFEAMDEAGAAPVRLMAVGGGLANRVWAQATSDFCGLDQIVPEKTIGASYGDAFLAALAVGDVAAGEIAAWNPEARRIAAAPTAAHARRLELFKALYLRTRDLMAALA